ncbi:MAG: hypothetical protein ACLTXI_06950 [Collinsella sp.]
MTYDMDMDIIALSPFEPNAMFATTEDSDTIRRFTTLLDCGAVGGGSHHLRKVANTEGETFALKTLWPLSGCDETAPLSAPRASRRSPRSIAILQSCHRWAAFQNLWLRLCRQHAGHPYGMD